MPGTLYQAPPNRPRGAPKELADLAALLNPVTAWKAWTQEGFGQDSLVYGAGLLLVVVGLVALAFASGAPQAVARTAAKVAA